MTEIQDINRRVLAVRREHEEERTVYTSRDGSNSPIFRVSPSEKFTWDYRMWKEDHDTRRKQEIT